MNEKAIQEAVAAIRYPIQSATEFASVQIPEPPQVIHGILRSGQVGMLAASSKAGKSWALLDLCMSASIGTDWLGWQTTAGRVLYINAELQLYDLQRRIEQLCTSKELDPIPEMLDLWHQRGRSRTISALIPEVIARIEKCGAYSLIIPDPLYCFGGGRDENDNAEQAKTMAELSELAERTGAAVWVAHHFSKGSQAGKDHLDRASGAGMFARAVDTFMTFTRHQEADCYSVETTTRSFAKPSSMVVRWEYPLWKIDDTLDPESLRVIGPTSGRPSKFTPEQLADLLPDCGLKANDFAVRANIDIGLGRSRFFDLLKIAIAKGLISKTVGGFHVKND